MLYVKVNLQKRICGKRITTAETKQTETREWLSFCVPVVKAITLNWNWFPPRIMIWILGYLHGMF